MNVKGTAMTNFKELNLIIRYDEFKHWKKNSPIKKRIPDNQLARVLISTCIAHRSNDENKIELLQNYLQFTDIPDFDEYQNMNTRLDLYRWLIEGVNLYDHVFTTYADMFSNVTHVYVESIEEEGIIKTIIAGRGLNVNNEKHYSQFSEHNKLYRSALL